MRKEHNVMESVEKLLREYKNGELGDIMIDTSFKEVHTIKGEGFSSTIYNPEVLTIHFTRRGGEISRGENKKNNLLD